MKSDVDNLSEFLAVIATFANGTDPCSDIFVAVKSCMYLMERTLNHHKL